MSMLAGAELIFFRRELQEAAAAGQWETDWKARSEVHGFAGRCGICGGDAHAFAGRPGRTNRVPSGVGEDAWMD